MIIMDLLPLCVMCAGSGVPPAARGAARCSSRQTFQAYGGMVCRRRTAARTQRVYCRRVCGVRRRLRRSILMPRYKIIRDSQNIECLLMR